MRPIIKKAQGIIITEIFQSFPTRPVIGGGSVENGVVGVGIGKRLG